MPCFEQGAAFSSREHTSPILSLDISGHVTVRCKMINVNSLAAITAFVLDEIVSLFICQGWGTWYPRGKLIIESHQ